jgi:Arf-GAP/SH3 domain/ANK repeat/PH domain-containing protein
MEPIDLRMASVREARNAERRFCFEVITPQFKRVYQATSEEDMANWILAINNALQSAVEGRSMPPPPRSQHESSSMSRDIGSILTGKSTSLNHGHHQVSGSMSNANSVFRRTTVAGRPTQPYSNAVVDDNPDKLLQALREADQANNLCADCGSGVKAEWVSINLGIILCIECSGIHRSLGTHISKVRSLTLDINSFTADIVELLLLVGNRVANLTWEAKLPVGVKPTAQATREQRLKYITAKYVERLYVEPISSTLSRYASAEETLLAAIKRNEAQQVIYGLALGASPNSVDKSRGTPAVFLALAAADPAAPGTPLTPMQLEGLPREKSFPLAELLLQNGAMLPTTLPGFPLSRNAHLYIQQKNGRAAGTTDSLSALPPSNGADRPKNETKLQKRISAGSRLARAVIPER